MQDQPQCDKEDYKIEEDKFVPWKRLFRYEKEQLRDALNKEGEVIPDKPKPSDRINLAEGKREPDKNTGIHYLTGLALSGGGVRSAVICLGAMSKLAKYGMLDKFDYLSSVSGGGYAGGALSHWQALHGDKTPLRKANPFHAYLLRHDKENKEEAQLEAQMAELRQKNEENSRYYNYVRRHVSYLLPGGAQALFSGFFVVIRAILLNLFIWITLVSLVMALILGLGHTFPDASPGSFLDQWFGSQSWICTTLGLTWDTKLDRVPLVLIAFSIVLLGIFFVLMLAFAFSSFFVSSEAHDGAEDDVSIKYWRRRAYEQTGGLLLKVFTPIAAFAAVPVVAENLWPILRFFDDKASLPNETILASLLTLIGIGVSAFGYLRERLGKTLPNANSVPVILGSFIFVYGFAVFAFILATEFWWTNGDFGQSVWPWRFALVAFVLAFVTNINEISLGRYYRDRLMETFMPDKKSVLEDEIKPVPEPAKAADVLKLKNLSSLRPIHLVCANVTPTGIKEEKARQRSGDSFVLSKHFCGSDITGYRVTEKVAQGNLGLAVAVAASGAAVNPRGGFAGSGPSTTSVTSLAMSLLSLRLGYWLAWDNPKWITSRLFRKYINPYGNYISPRALFTLSQLLDWSYPAKASKFIEITDGGHFENLGLYELVRRRCGLIVVIDGGADPETSYDSFTAALERVKQDFGATVSFDVEIDRHATNKRRTEMRLSQPGDLVTRGSDEQYPKGVDYASKGYFMARIRYEGAKKPCVNRCQSDTYSPMKDGSRYHADGPKEGLLIYLKSTMLDDLEHTSKGFKGANPSFPNDSTGNQFFSAQQFDAYFDVGEKIAGQMLKDTQIHELFKDEWPTLERIMLNHFFQIQGPAAEDGSVRG
ncbi:MAG: hypothetical protein AAGE61_08915 [Pseudomonadota bacterium]